MTKSNSNITFGREPNNEQPVEAHQPAGSNQEKTMTDPKMTDTVPQDAKSLKENEAAQKAHEKGIMEKAGDFFSKYVSGPMKSLWNSGTKYAAKLGKDIVNTFTTRDGYAELFSKLGENAGKILVIGVSAALFQVIAMKFGLILAVAALAGIYVICQSIALMTTTAPLHEVLGVDAPAVPVQVPAKAA